MNAFSNKICPSLNQFRLVYCCFDKLFQHHFLKFQIKKKITLYISDSIGNNYCRNSYESLNAMHCCALLMSSYIRGRPQTRLTEFCPLLTTYPPPVDICEIRGKICIPLKYPVPVPTSSCQRSLWMTPNNIELQVCKGWI